MLYFIPTPIGNKEDLTFRALRLFQALQIFLCEDTRTTKKLFAIYDIEYQKKQFHALTSFSDASTLNYYKKLITENDVAMVSEAGTPGLSDPGKSLIQLCNEAGLPYSILPGANALVPAIVGAGFDTSTFTFLGFLPQKKGRQAILKEAIERNHPTFFYESVHRIEKLITELHTLGFQGNISIAREISKLFEQFRTGNIADLEKMLNEKKLPLKGEFVVGINT